MEVQCEVKPLSVGVRTRAGSTMKPRDWAYSINASLKRGSVGSAPTTTDDILSGFCSRLRYVPGGRRSLVVWG
jgi:hypothetical protein